MFKLLLKLLYIKQRHNTLGYRLSSNFPLKSSNYTKRGNSRVSTYKRCIMTIGSNTMYKKKCQSKIKF